MYVASRPPTCTHVFKRVDRGHVFTAFPFLQWLALPSCPLSCPNMALTSHSYIRTCRILFAMSLFFVNHGAATPRGLSKGKRFCLVHVLIGVHRIAAGFGRKALSPFTLTTVQPASCYSCICRKNRRLFGVAVADGAERQKPRRLLSSRRLWDDDV